MIDLIPDLKYPELYRLRWPNGDTSADLYNKQRAQEISFLCEQRAKRDKKMIQYGELWDFPTIGQDKAYDGRTFVFHGSTYSGTPWTRITHQRASEASS